jgi:DNA primase
VNDLKELKRKIYEDNRIEEVLELMGCTHISFRNRMFTAALPSGDNARSVQIKNNESLTSSVRSRGKSGDIFMLVSFIVNGITDNDEIQADLHNAKKWLIDNLQYFELYDSKYKPQEKDEWNGWLKKIKKKRSKSILKQYRDNELLEESIVHEFHMFPWQEWVDEGIEKSTQAEFEVGFDLMTKRVVTLVRNKDGELIGVKGRTTDPRYKELDIPKYLYIYPMDKSVELFNFHRAYEHILEKRQVFVFEGYKSVMKAHQYGYKNAVSIEGDDISDAQVKLLKGLGLDIEIVLCFDKDKTDRDVIDQAKKITNRTLTQVADEVGYLGHKDSPVDKGTRVWEELVSTRIDVFSTATK